MGNISALINSVIVISLIYFFAVLLRHKKVLKEEHSLTFARVVTDLFLPAIVFTSIAKQSIEFGQMKPALVMLFLEVFFVLVAWGISVLLKFDKPKQGAIVFCSAFGSSTFLGYSVITQMYPNTPQALSEAVIISEIGVGYPIFILGPILAAYFGSKKLGKSDWKASLSFFRSPVFFALIAGLIWSLLKLPGKENVFVAPIFQLSSVLAAALTPVAILSVGLMFKKPKIRVILFPLLIVVLLKLFLKPMLANFVAVTFSFPDLWREVLVILAAMPSAVLGVVFLRRYGGDASLASALLLVTTLFSAISLLAIYYFFL